MRYLVGLNAIFLCNFRTIECLVCWRIAKNYGDVGTQTIGHREARRGVPLVLDICAKLRRGDICRRVADRVVADILASVVVQEVIEGGVGVGSQSICHIEARRVENLVVCTNGNGVRVGVVREVVGQCNCVLHQVVHNGKRIGADIYRGILAVAHLLNLDIRI